VSDFGLGTVRYCPSSACTSCECAGVAILDVGVAASSSSDSASAGAGATYTISVTNNDAAATATGVVLSLEPSAGVQLSSSSLTSSQGSCDTSVNICTLGNLAAGQSATVSVNAVFPTSGTWPVTFSVTHHEADPTPANDSVTLSEWVL
jgi:uncharacterized repeat protein (TIGR01451 family)